MKILSYKGFFNGHGVRNHLSKLSWHQRMKNLLKYDLLQTIRSLLKIDPIERQDISALFNQTTFLIGVVSVILGLAAAFFGKLGAYSYVSMKRAVSIKRASVQNLQNN